MNPLTRFLNFWAGVDNLLLARCPHHERLKYTSIGILVLLTGTFAFMASGYALFTVFESIPVAITLGILWGFLIINLDRLMLTTFPKSAGFFRQLLHATPRLVLAVLIGATIAHPLTLRLFEPEILEQISKDREDERVKKIEQWADEKKRDETDLQDRKRALPEAKEVDRREGERKEKVQAWSKCTEDSLKAKQEYLCEADGTCGTRIKSCGPVCRQKEAEYRNIEGRCEILRQQIASAERSLKESEHNLSQATAGMELSFRQHEDQKDDERMRAMKRIESSQKTSFLIRSEALGNLTDEHQKAAITRLSVSLLFVLVEVLAVLVKIISPVDSADKLASAVRDAFAGKIGELAAELASIGGHQVRHHEPEPVTASAAVVDNPAREALKAASLRRIIAVCGLTILITGGMLLFGGTLEQAFAAGTLFTTITPQVVQHQERWADLNMTGGS